MALGVAGCGEKVKQNIKNDAYSLNSAWLNVSQTLQQTQSKLMVANRQVDENASAIDDSSNVTAKLDSAGWVNLERYTLSVQQAESQFSSLKNTADSLKSAYEEQHAAYNTFLSKIDKNSIGNDEARDKVEAFKDQQSALATEAKLLTTRYAKAVKSYNHSVSKLKSLTRNYRLQPLPEPSGANLE